MATGKTEVVTVPVRIRKAWLDRIDEVIPYLEKDPDEEGMLTRSGAIRKLLLHGLKLAEMGNKKWKRGRKPAAKRSTGPRRAKQAGKRSSK